MEKTKSLLFGKNLFAKAFQQFEETSFFQRLEETIKPQPYYHKYKSFKVVIVTLSYLFNIISAFTASYLVFWLARWLTGIAIISYALSGVFLFFLEQLKRKSSSEFFQIWFFEKRITTGWLALSFSVFIASVASTYYGTDKATWDFAPDAPVVTQDSTLNSLYDQLAMTEAQITEARATRWQGTTTRTSQRTIEQLTSQKTMLLADITKRVEGKDKNNTIITNQHSSEIQLTATTLAWLTVLFEILFECCIAYIWYYYHRSYVERKSLQIMQATDNLLPVTPKFDELAENNDIEILKKLFKQIQTEANQQNSFQVQHTQNGQDDNSNDTIQNHVKLPVGFYSKAQRKKQLENVFKHQKQVFKHTNYPQGKVHYQDLFTVAHKDFKTGNIRHVNLGNIKNMIGIYINRATEAQETGNAVVLKNRLEKLQYWLSKEKELKNKITSVRS